MELATITVSIVIALLAVLVKFIATPLKRMMTHDVRLVFSDGKKVTLPVTRGTPESDIAQEINDALNKVLFGEAGWRNSGGARWSGNKAHGAAKYVTARAFMTGEPEHFRKTVRLKHVEAWFLDKENTEIEGRRHRSGHRGAARVTTKITEGALHPVRARDWMKKHDEVFPVAGEA
jgi:hypothetical protein